MARTPARSRVPAKPRPAPPVARAPRPDKYVLYELCAQAPETEARFLAAVHAGRPRTLRDDFAGPGGIARAWVRVVPGGRAIAVDSDPEPLAYARGHDRVEPLQADALATRRKADVIAAFNFAVCELHDRPTLLRYLRAARTSLRAGGVFAADLYGGADAYTPGTYRRTLRGPASPDGPPQRVEYTWEQRAADPVTARVVNAMHFRVHPPAGAAAGARAKRPVELLSAFVYDWRLWSIPELSDALREAGFASVEVYDRYGDAADSDGNLYPRLVEPGEGLDENYVVYVVGRR